MTRHDAERVWRNFLARLDNQSLVLKIPFLLSAILVGLMSVGFAAASERATELFLDIVKHWPYFPLFLTPLALVGSRWIVLRFAPAAAGSGIPQAIAALDLADEKPGLLYRLLGLRILVVKILSNFLALLGGGVAGREGPMVQI
ncbi:MAG: chloride channel protein, partial [Proteobacteria bacterium]